MKADGAPVATRLCDYQPPAFLVDEIALNFILHDEVARVESTLSLRRNRARTGRLPLVLDGSHLKLLSVALNDTPVAPEHYQLDEQSLCIEDVPDAFELSVVTAIKPHDNTALEGLYQSGGNYCTQCEAQGFRRITYYPDRPDVMALFQVSIEADKARYPVLLSNGHCIAHGDLAGGRHFATWRDPHPKPSYLFALVAGDLACIEDAFVTVSGREVALRIYVEAHNADQCAHAMRSLKKAMRWDEQVFGLECDLDLYMIVAVDDFNMGAMENKGLNLFNSKFVLADQKTATDSDFQNIEGVIAHEYFHNWTGNRVTCRDWFQLSLKEGLTVFRDQQFSADMNSPAVKRIEDVRLLQTRQFPEDASPTAHPVRPDSYIEIDNFYTLTVYEKGAEVIRMLHTLLGAERFREGMDLYFARHDGQAVTCDDFVRAMADAGGVDLTIFKRWYAQAGTPELRVTMHYDATRKTCTLDFVQSTPPTPGQTAKLPVHMPVRVGLLAADGSAMALHGEGAHGATECLIELFDERHGVVFERVDTPPVPSLLRGFSAPVKLSFDYSDAQLALLMAHDSDSFNRWDASRQLALRVAVQWIEERRARRATSVPRVWLKACRALATSDIDPALLAEALHLPSEETIGEAFLRIDMQELFSAREFMLSTLADALQPVLLSTYRRHRDDAAAIDAAAIGRRKLKNACLLLLAHCVDRGGVELAVEQFATATNMTDEMAALQVLCNTDEIDRQPYLDRFYTKWHDRRLVIDKWFSLQAMSTQPDTPQRVRALTRHADFDLRNPNRVRALLAAFSIGNPVRFHAADGAGYALLSDYIIELDSINPQIAARLVAPMSRWRRHSDANRVLMQRQLQRILSHDGLSGDVYELVEKNLR